MLRRQKHVLSQSATPFACTLFQKSGWILEPHRRSPTYGPPQSSRVRESFGKSDMHGLKHVCGVCKTFHCHGRSDQLMSIKERVLHALHFCDLCRRSARHGNHVSLLIFRSVSFLKPAGTDTKYDRAKLPPYNGSDPTSPHQVYKPLRFHTYFFLRKQKDGKGARKVRRSTSSIFSIGRCPSRPVILVPEGRKGRKEEGGAPQPKMLEKEN